MRPKILKTIAVLLLLASNFACNKEFTELQIEKVAVIRNRAYSDLQFNDTQSPCVIKPGLSIINTGVENPYTFTAYTFGKTTSNTQLGERIDWSRSLSFERDTVYEEISTSTEYFFLFVKNLSAKEYGPIIINYGTTNEIEENVLIPGNEVSYQIAYYKALYNSQIRFYNNANTSEYVTFTAGVNFNFPNTKNQYILITINAKGEFIFTSDEKPINTRRVSVLETK